MCRGVLAASTGTGRFIRARRKLAADRAAHTCKSRKSGAALSGWIEITDVEKQATKVGQCPASFLLRRQEQPEEDLLGAQSVPLCFYRMDCKYTHGTFFHK